MPSRPGGDLGPGLQIQLLEDVLHVPLGPLADHELSGYLPVGQTLGAGPCQGVLILSGAALRDAVPTCVRSP